MSRKNGLPVGMLLGLLLVVLSTSSLAWAAGDLKVSRVAGDERMNEINSAYFATWSHLLPGRLAGDIEYLGTEEKTGAHILQIQPEGGREVTFFLDPVRYLPLRSGYRGPEIPK